MENGLGSRIKAERIKKGKTLEVVAKAVGISRQTLSRYETGVITNIPSDKIEKIAEYFGVSPAQLMGWEEIEKEAEILSDLFHEIKEDKDLRSAVQALVRIKKNNPKAFDNITGLIATVDK